MNNACIVIPNLLSSIKLFGFSIQFFFFCFMHLQAVIGNLIFDEHLSLRWWGGTSLVVAGLIFITIGNKETNVETENKIEWTENQCLSIIFQNILILTENIPFGHKIIKYDNITMIEQLNREYSTLQHRQLAQNVTTPAGLCDQLHSVQRSFSHIVLNQFSFRFNVGLSFSPCLTVLCGAFANAHFCETYDEFLCGF